MARDTTPRTARQAAQLLARWVTRLVLLAFALLVVAALVVVVVLPRATHGSALTVLTGSMTPEIPVGSVVVIRPVDTGTLRVGDVVTYQAEPGKPGYITHRIEKVDSTTTPTSFVLKGDANRGPDLDPVVPDQIRGEVWFHVPYLGAIRDALHGKGGITLVAMLLLGGYALSQLGAGLRDRKAQGTPDTARSGDIAVNRLLVLAHLDKARLDSRTGLSPDAIAALWSAAVVHEDETSCLFLLTPAPEAIAVTLERLHDVQPLQLRIIDQAGTLSGLEARSLTRTREEDERAHA